VASEMGPILRALNGLTGARPSLTNAAGQPVRMVGISGASRAGKSSLAKALSQELLALGVQAPLIKLDQHFNRDHIQSNISEGFPNWESFGAPDHRRILAEVEKRILSTPDDGVVRADDGHMPRVGEVMER
jgi:adenylylsulfate kinase-like enzyme